MANNNDIEIKVKVDTSDVDKSFKDIEKSSDKMAKSVSSDVKRMSKDTEKINKVFKDLQKTLKNSSKDMQNAFKNINTNGFNKTMNDMKQTATKTASSIKQQLQDAFNVKGNVKVSTTTDKSNGASSSGNGMANSLAGSAMTGGAIGSKIAKELAQSQKEVAKAVSGIKEAFGQVPETVQKDVENSVSEIVDTLKEVEPLIYSIFSDGDLALNVDLSSMKDLKGLAIGMLDNLKANIEATNSGMEKLIRMKERLSAKGEDVSLIEDDIKLQQEELDRYTRSVEKLQNLLNSGAFDKIDFATNLDTNKIVVEIDRLLGKFEEVPVVMKKVDAQPIVEQFRLLQQAMQSLGYDTSVIDKVLIEWDRVCRTGSKGTIELTNAIKNARTYVTGLNQGTKQLVQTQIQQATSGKSVVKEYQAYDSVLQKVKAQLQDFGTALKQAFSSGMQKAGQYIDNLKNKSQQMANAHKQAANKIKSANAGIMASFKGLLTTMMPFLTLYGAFNLLKTSVTEAMGAIESNNMYMAVFGDKASEMDKWVKSVNQSMGLGVNNTKQYTAIIQQMGSAMGLTSDEAMNMSQKMAVMAGDISSFYNVDLSQAQNDLRSALSGSNEVLTKYGIVLREDTIKSYAYANGIATMGAELTSAQRAMVLTMMVEQQLGQANGDMARTLDSPANRARRLSSAMYDLRVALGNVVLPIWNAVMPGLIALANALTAVFNKIASVINGILSLFGLGLKGGSSGGSGGGFLGDVADSVGGIGSSLGDGLDKASGGSGKVADDLKDSAKSAKEIAKSLMGIDEINNLSSPSNSGGSGSGGSGSGGSGGGAGGGLGGLGDLGLSDKVETQIVETGDGIPKWLQRMADVFKNAFDRSFNYDMFKDFLKNCERVKQALNDIFSNKELQIAMNALKMTTIAELGSWIGTIGTLFFSIGNAIVGGLANSLEKNKQYIIDKLIGIANIEREASIMRQRLSEALSEIFSTLGGEEAQTIVENIFDTLTVGFLEGQELFSKLGRDMTLIIAQSIIENKDKIKEALENSLSFVGDITGTISTFFQDAFKKVNEVYDKHIKPFIDSFSQGLSNLWGTLLDGYNTYFKPAMDNIAQKFEEVMNGSVGECVANFLDLIGDIFDCLTVLWNEYLQPLLDWAVGVLAPLFAGAWDIICTAVLNAIDVIAQVINGIIEIFRGIIQFLTGVFSGDWQKAWDGLCLIFEGFKDIIMAIWDNLVNNTREIVDKLKGWLLTAWEAIKENTVKLVKKLWSEVVDRWKKLGSDISTLLQNISSTCKTKWEEIKQKVIDKVKEMWSKVTEWIGKIKDNIVKWCSDLLTNIKDGWKKIVDGIKDKCTEIWDNITGWFKDIVGLFTGGWKDSDKETEKGFGNIEETAKIGADKTKTGIMSKLKGVLPDMSTLWSNVKSGASDKWSSIKETVTSWSSKAKDGIKNSLSGVTGNLSTIWSNVKSGATTAWSNIKGGVSDWATRTKDGTKNSLSGVVGNVSTIWGNIKNGVSGAWNRVKSAVSGSVTGVKNQVDSSLKGAITNVSNIWLSISRGVSGAWNGIRSQVQSAVDRVKSIMNFSWSLPRPKIPKFNISGGQAPWGFMGQGKLPSISISWFANGGIMTKPTMFGMNGNSAMVGGEAGAEAILPLSKLWQQMDAKFAQQNAMITNAINNRPINAELTVNLDGKKVAKNTYKNLQEMQRLGQIQY